MRELVARPTGVWVTCAGRSMEPTVLLGERVRVRAARPRAGDVVLVAGGDGQGFILHRLVLWLPGGRWFLHTGDTPHRGPPSLARAHQVVGRADLPRRRPSPRTLARAGLTVLEAALARGPL